MLQSQVKSRRVGLKLGARLCGFALAAWPAWTIAQQPGHDAPPDVPPPPAAITEAEAQRDAKFGALISEVVEPEVLMHLNPQRSKLVRTKRPVTRFSVTTPTIVDVVQFGPTEFELIGKAEGTTSLTLWFAGDVGEETQVLRYMVDVSRDLTVEDRRRTEYTDLQKQINELFPNSMIQLIPVADKLIVRGQARDAEEATQIMAIIRSRNYSGTGNGGGTYLVNQGPASDPFPGVSVLPTSNVISLLDVPGEMQVMVKVRVAELTRTALREIGANFNAKAGDFGFGSNLGVNGAFSAVLSSTDVQFALTALASNSTSKILAEPNLVTLSGRPASFIAGGEFAVPIVVGVEGAAAATTNFRGFGTQLTFIPTVMDKDRIRLQVAPSFSTLNEENTVNGIPGLNSRAVSTTVDLRDGQWLAIAGLLQDQQSGSKTRVPLLGDIPVVDTIFSRKSAKREETELMVLVSPELVHPLEAEEMPLILPGMEVTEPTDFAFYVLGRYEGDPDCQHRSTVWPIERDRIIDARHAALKEAKRQSKYQQCENYYVAGPHGFSR